MANPNIFAAGNIIGDTAVTNASTSAANLVSGEANKVKKINSIIVANYGSTDQSVTIDIYRSTVSYFVANQVVVPAKSTLLLVGKEHSFYLTENDTLRVLATAANSVTVTCSFETLY
jgi:hypothetical protein